MKKNTNLIVVVPCHNGDFPLAEQLIAWIGELDGKLPFPILIAVDQTVDMNRVVPLFEAAKAIFEHARAITLQIPAGGWKPNAMFLASSKYVMENYECPFLWLEPDCVPLKSGWLADLNEAYQKTPLRFMGAVVEQSGQKGLPAKHLTGCSVYPNDAYVDFERIAEVNSGRAAWDIGGGEKIVTASQNTTLIQHFWGSQDKPPVFVETRTVDAPENHVMLDFIKPNAVLFHRSKDGNLLAILRKNKPKQTPPKTPSQTGDGAATPEQPLSDADLEKLTAPNPPAQTKTLE